MPPAPYDVLDLAKLQVQNLPDAEKVSLGELFRDQRRVAASIDVGGGNFVARLGTHSVLWRRGVSGRSEVLSVLDRSYAETA